MNNRTSAISLGLALASLASGQAIAQDDEEKPERGLVLNESGAFDGFTLLAPLRSKTTYLIGMDGRVVHTWPSDYTPGNAVFLQNDGSIVRCGRVQNDTFSGGGQGGRIQRIAWDGEVLWDFDASTDEFLAHHDIAPLPNGNLLVIAWILKSQEEALAAGRDPEHAGERGFWPDVIYELEPLGESGESGARTVWEWNAWDHIVQDLDPEKPNYGAVPDHPELIDLNGDHRRDRPMTAEERRQKEETERKMRATGYAGGEEEDEEEEDEGERPRRRQGGDWLHSNSIDYDAENDLILLSVRRFNEFWVIDHSTTTDEARGHKGGKRKQGGDLLYRWGNPRVYGAGGSADQRLFGQHDAQWIPTGSPGAGHVLVFNNGEGRPNGPFSSVDEIALPFAPAEGTGSFVRAREAAFGPNEPVWSYATGAEETFYSSFISGAQRLPNGNTLICSGANGRLFEVDGESEIVWEYLNPYGGEEPLQPPRGRDPGTPDGGGAGRRPDPSDGHGGRPPGAPGRPGGGDRGGGRPNMIPHGLFRATRIAPDHPGLKGLALERER